MAMTVLMTTMVMTSLAMMTRSNVTSMMSSLLMMRWIVLVNVEVEQREVVDLGGPGATYTCWERLSVL